MNKTIQVQHYYSPCGDLILGSYGNELCLCNWVIEKHQGRVDKRLQSLLNADYAIHASDITQEAARQLDEYFGRKRTTFDIPLLFAGTDFQKMYGVRCWKYPMDRRFLTERWLDGSDCRMLSVRWRMRMEQMQYPSLLLVIGLSGVIDRLRDTAAGSKQKIFVGIGTGKNAWRISLFFIKVNISDIGKFGYFCGVKM